MSVIFVAGIHAVGKTTACQEVVKALPVRHHTASQLIREEKAAAVDCGSKLVADVDGNQRLLIQAVRRVKAAYGRILLDGHFTLKNKLGGIETIDVAVFANLGISGIAVYKDAPERIAQRINQRDGAVCSVSDIESHQAEELAHSRLVSSSLAIPLVELQAFDTDGLVNACHAWMMA